MIDLMHMHGANEVNAMSDEEGKSKNEMEKKKDNPEQRRNTR